METIDVAALIEHRCFILSISSALKMITMESTFTTTLIPTVERRTSWQPLHYGIVRFDIFIEINTLRVCFYII